MRTLTFNRAHKNGWLSYKLTGVPGAVYVDKRMLSAEALANPAQTITVDIPGMAEPGADASAQAQEKAAAKAAKEAAKADKATKAAAKAQERLVKLQEAANKAAAKLAAVSAGSGAAAPAESVPATE